MLILKIAARNVLRQKRRTALTMLTMIGGFTLAAVAIGWSDGTYSYIINMFTRNRLGQIQVHGKGFLDSPNLYNTIRDYHSVGREIQQVKGVEAWAPRLLSAGLASVGDKTAGTQLIGIDPGLEERATHFGRLIVQGSGLSAGPSRQALLGKGLADALGARINDEIVVVSQAADGSIANDLFRLTGIVVTGDEMSDRSSLYMNLGDAQALLALEGEVHEIIVIVADLDSVGETTQAIRDRLLAANLDVQPWQVFARTFYVAMQADVKGMWIMLFVIMLIVAIGVLNTVLMSVLERRREYGLMKAVGTQPRQIIALVLTEVLILAVGSVVLASGLSVAANFMLAVYGIPLPTPFTFGGVEFSKMYSEVNTHSLYIPALSVIAAALLVSLPPAWKAAGTEPSRAMRTF